MRTSNYKRVDREKNGMESWIPYLDESKYLDMINDTWRWANDLIGKMVIWWRNRDGASKHDQDSLGRSMIVFK